METNPVIMAQCTSCVPGKLPPRIVIPDTFYNKISSSYNGTPNIFTFPLRVLSKCSFVWENIFLPRLPFATPERFSGILFIDDLIKITRRKLTFGIVALCIFHFMPLFMAFYFRGGRLKALHFTAYWRIVVLKLYRATVRILLMPYSLNRYS